MGLARADRLDARAALAWGLSVAWAAFVWGLGGDRFSNESTSGILGPLLQWLLPDADVQTLDALQWSIRKTAHAVEYAILTLLLLRAVWLSSAAGFAAVGWIALTFVSLLAAGDEWRQSLSVDRDGSPVDALLDMSGGIAALVLFHFLPAAVRSGWLPTRTRTRTGPRRGKPV